MADRKTTPPSTALPLHQIAVRVAATDNVAVVKYGAAASTVVEIPAGSGRGSNATRLTLLAEVPGGHRFALSDIPAGAFVRQYGQPVGTSLGIKAGQLITHELMSDEIPVIRDLPPQLSTPAPDFVPEEARPTFAGYRRADGRTGTRNWIAIIPTSMCASHEAQQIANTAEFTLWSAEEFANVDGVVALGHNKGCGTPDGANIHTILRTLAAFARHPNVGAVIFLELGCEKTGSSILRDWMDKNGLQPTGKPVSWIGIQDAGGTKAAIRRGLDEVRRMLPLVNQARRESLPVSDLVLGLKCGGSDGFSGLTANPALGHAADLIVRHGGTAILTEVPEFCGAEHVLALRARDAAIGKQVYELVDWYKAHTARIGASLGMNPSPGNVAGGLLNIALKSLGAIAKGGTTRVEGVMNYAESPPSRGLNLMQGPGYDQESVPGLVAAGCNVVVFTTGRGSTMGNAIVPVVKLASNTPIFDRMNQDLDLNAGTILDGAETIEQVGARLFAHLQKVAAKEALARAEETGHREFQIWAPEPVSL
jgi:altronate hydrolase